MKTREVSRQHGASVPCLTGITGSSPRDCCRPAGSGCVMGDVTGTRPLALATTGPGQGQAGEPGDGLEPDCVPRWMLSARFCWGLAAAALLLTLASGAIAAADGDLLLLLLVPSPPVAALMGGLVAARRPGHLVGVL